MAVEVTPKTKAPSNAASRSRTAFQRARSRSGLMPARIAAASRPRYPILAPESDSPGLRLRLLEQGLGARGVALALQERAHHQGNDEGRVGLDHEHRRVLRQLVPGDLLVGGRAGVG